MRAVRAASSLATILTFLAAAAGCQDSISEPSEEGAALQPGHALLGAATDVRLSVEASAFAPGAPVTLVLENRSAEQIGFNLCFHAIERRSGAEWVPQPDSRICTTHLNLLDPGATARHDAELPALADGEYRFRVALHLMGQQQHRDQVSDSFTIGD